MENQQNFIFLDIDGVANSTDSIHASIGPTELTSEKVKNLGSLTPNESFVLKHADPVSIALINRLIKETNANLVLISSHRFNFQELGFGSQAHLKKLRLFLNAMGLQFEYLSITNSQSTPREKQVSEWICMAWENGIDVDRYVILDDSKEFKDPNFVWCDPSQGFTFKEYAQASLLLGAPVSKILLA